MKKIDTKKLTVSAIMIALATVLSLIKVWTMPLGGAVTLLSMLPVALIAIIYGTKHGLWCAFVYSLCQLGLSIAEVVGWGLTPTALIGTIFLDYIIAFTVLGLAGLFAKNGVSGYILGITLSLILRFLCHFISGVIIFDIWMPEEWSNIWLYSLCYNGAYMLPELITTIVGAVVLLKLSPIKRLIKNNE